MRHVYVHVPFCRRRCVYCDFAISVRKEVPGKQFASAIAAEMALKTPANVGSPAPETVYFGGGTPSLLDHCVLGDLVAMLAAPARPDDVEVTIEVNPDDANDEKVGRWRAAGVNRASLGVQSFQDNVLAWMHRTHSAVDGVMAARRLREAMPQLSLDLIFGMPPELQHDFESDLERALAIESDHISVYGLTVEAGTALGKWVGRGITAGSDDPEYAEQFMLAHDTLTAAGYEHYEISNYARPGARSRHNSCYWSGASYVGLGPSAHSFAAETATRSWNLRNWPAYERAVAAGGTPTAGEETLTAGQLGLERLFLGLRTADGVPLETVRNRTEIDRLVEDGLALLRGESLALTPHGWLKTDQIAVRLTTSAEGG